MRSCPVGSHITTLAECAEAYKQLKDMFRYPSLRGVVANENPGWEGVPRRGAAEIIIFYPPLLWLDASYQDANQTRNRLIRRAQWMSCSPSFFSDVVCIVLRNVLGACEIVVVRGCSIQIGSLGADNSPHFNGNKYSKGQRGLLGTGTGDFATQAEFQYLGVKEVLSGSIVTG